MYFLKNKIDENGDGVIDFDEFKTMMVNENFITLSDPLPETDEVVAVDGEGKK